MFPSSLARARRLLLPLAALALAGAGRAYEGADLVPAISAPIRFGGVTLTASGRIFMPFKQQIQVGEIVDGKVVPYPDAGWNAWHPGQDATHAFVRVNSLRIGPDGDLWILDRGVPDVPLAAGGPKLVQFDVSRNAVRRIYDLGTVAGGATGGFTNDIRFHGRRAYITNAGTPSGIILLDLDSGALRQVLTGHSSTRALRLLMGEGHVMENKEGVPVRVNADQLEVSPDGRWLYYQPACGPMARIATRFLNDPALSAEAIAAQVEPFAETPSCGGTAMDGDGNLYVADANRSLILKITPDGRMDTLVQDPRLVFVDAMWIDEAGDLWMPAVQSCRTPGANRGVDAVQYPIVTYKLKLGAKPLR